MKFVSRAWQSVLDLLYPRICVGCNHDLALDGSHFCMSCLSKMPYTHDEATEDNPFEAHFWGRVPIKAGMALGYFVKDGILQQAMHAMKYQHLPEVGFELGQALGIRMSSHEVFSTCDCILPVPLHREKRLKRGYNQCDYIAEGIGDILGIPVDKTTIVRRRSNASQTKKSRVQRMKNVDELFSAKEGEALEYHHYLLVDDVMTSGATLDAFAQSILKYKDCDVSMATLAMGAPV